MPPLRPTATTGDSTAEAELVACAAALVGDAAGVSAAERRLIAAAPPADPRRVRQIGAGIAAGDDPLGRLFCAGRSGDDRRRRGAVYTPPAIVEAMVDWVAGQTRAPARIIDPGAGSGRFLCAAARRFPRAALLAVEIDPVAAILLRATATCLGLADRLTVMVGDYCRVRPPAADGPTLFIGNPPYVRHHDIPAAAKARFGAAARQHGLRASGLAGLHVHFLLRTLTLARPGDIGCLITAAEWLDVNYGALARTVLADRLGGTLLQVLSPRTRPFADAMTTAVIAGFAVGTPARTVLLRRVDRLDDLAPLARGHAVDRRMLAAAPKWSPLAAGPVHPPRRPAGGTDIGTLFRVHRGQVTGANAVWIDGPATPAVPERFRLPCITRATELLAAGDRIDDDAGLRRVIDLPPDLEALPAAERAAIDRFLAWARSHGADRRYVARHRAAWWSVGLKPPAPILCTYMARRPPVFVRNTAGVRHINIAHGLYPRAPLSDADLDRIAALLTSTAPPDGGRTYAGGLLKFEPREIERLRIPPTAMPTTLPTALPPDRR